MASTEITYGEPVRPPVTGATITLNEDEAEVMTALLGALLLSGPQVGGVYKALRDAGFGNRYKIAASHVPHTIKVEAR